MPITPWLVHFCYLHLYFLTSKTVTIIMLEYACRIRTSSPGLTLAKALDEAYSRCKQSGTHKVVKTQFQGSPNKYSVSQFTEFILQHRLWHLLVVAILLPLFIVCTLYESGLSQLLGTSIQFWIELKQSLFKGCSRVEWNFWVFKFFVTSVSRSTSTVQFNATCIWLSYEI